jgi:hypothetical protein
MATIMPARNYWQIPFLEGNWWTKPEPAMAGGTAYNTFEMLISGTGDGVYEQTRCAMKFDITAAPAWVTDGDAVELDGLIFLYLGSDSSNSGTGMKAALVTAGAWNESSNWATMHGLTLAAFTSAQTPLPSGKIRGWIAVPFSYKSADYRNTLGLVLKVDLATGLDCYKILKNPAPYVRAYYQYPVDDVIEADATQRLTLTDAIKADTGKPTTKYSLSGKIQQSHISAIDEDIPVIIGKNSVIGILDRKMNFPETWQPKFEGRSSIQLKKDIDVDIHTGKLFCISHIQRSGQKATAEIGKSAVIIGESHEGDTEYEVTLEDPINETIGRAPYRKDTISGMQGVNILDENALWCAVSMFVNGAGIPWERFRQADLVWLLRRFGSVWSRITKSSTALSAEKIGSLLKEWGEMYGICYGRGSDDAILIFHPSAYRPSMEVWDFNLDNANNIDLVDRERNKQYDVISVNGYKVTFPGARSTKYDRVDTDYPITGLIGDFSHNEAKSGLGLQLASRLCGRYRLLTFTTGAKPFLWEEGDQVRITSVHRKLTAVPFLVIGVKSGPIKGRNSVTMAHYPDSPEIHNTFLNTGLQGLWPWYNWYSKSGTGANQSWIGSAGGWTGGGFGTPSQCKYIDWQGAIGGLDETIGGSNFAPVDTADLCDLVDFILGLYGDQSTNPYGVGRDNEYNQILSFRDGNEAVIVGIHRVDTGGGGGIQAKAVENTLFLAHTTNYTLQPVSWTQIVETSPGIGLGNGWIDYGVAIQWKNTECRLYVNRQYIDSITISKAGFDAGTRAVETQIPTEQLVGLMRWLQRTDGEWFETNRMLGKNGTDPYYP